MALVATPADQWVAPANVDRCELCRLDFGLTRRKNHCALCGHVFCGKCSDFWGPPLPAAAGDARQQQKQQQQAISQEKEVLERRCRRCYEAYTRSEKEKAAAAVEEAAAAAAAERAAEQLALTQRHSRVSRIEAGVLDTGRTFGHGLSTIGRRAEAEKSYFLCSQPGDGREQQEVLLALVRPQRRNIRLGEELREFILGLQHPFVMPVVDLMFFPETETQAPGASSPPLSLGVFRSVAAWGSLRDVLHSGADPALPIEKKYAAARRLGSPLPQDRLALYGRQILEAIVFLQSVWVSCAGVTTSNVLVLSDDWCVVTDWENDLVGMRSSSTRHDWLATRPHPATYAFGHVLYEMASGGAPLLSNTLPPTLQTNVPVPVLQVLDTIFNYPVGDKFEALDVVSLLALPFFSTVVLRDRHLRLLITPSATTAAHRQLLSDCGFVPSSTGKKEERAARRRARDFGRETKADQRYSKEERRMDRMARRMRHQTRKNQRAAKQAGRAVVAGGIAQGDGQALHCVEFESGDTLGLDLEGILPDPGPGKHRKRDDSGDVTVVGVESGGQADRLAVQVGMVLLSVAGVSVVDPDTSLPRSVGEVFAMVNAARQATPKLMLEFAYPPPPAPEDSVVQIDPTEPMGLELTDAVRPGDEDSPWKVRCISVVPGSQADDYGLDLPCVLTTVGGRSVADRGFDYVLSVLELAKGEAEESKGLLELRFQSIPKQMQWVTEPDGAETGAKMDAVTRHVFVNSEPLGIELADSDGDVRAIAIHPGGQGDLLGVPKDRLLATVQDETVLGLSFAETVGKIQAAKSGKQQLTLGFQAALSSDDPVLAAISSDQSAPLGTLELSGAAGDEESGRIVSGFAFSTQDSLGLEMEEAGEADESWKVQVIGCVPKSAADRFGVARGSLVTAVQGEACEGLSFEEVVGKLSAAKSGADALFGIPDYVCIQFVSPQGEPPPARPRANDSDTEELSEVAAWLRSVGMKRHCQVFEENAIDEMELMEELGEAQLKEMGLAAVERRLLLRAIRDWSTMGREEAKRAAAAAAEAQILKLHRENAELRARLSTADSKAIWAQQQAAQLAALRAQGAAEEAPVAITDAKPKKSKKKKNIEKHPPLREPRLDGSRRRDEVADALDAQEDVVAKTVPRPVKHKPHKQPKQESGGSKHKAKRREEEPAAPEPEVDDSWLDDDPVSEPEYAASESMASEEAYSLPKKATKSSKPKVETVDKQRSSRPKSLKPSIFEDEFSDSDDEGDQGIGWGDRARRESLGGSSIHSSIFGGTDTDTSIASTAPFGEDSSDAGSVLSTSHAPAALAIASNQPVATLKGSELNTTGGMGMPKFGLRGDDAGMFDLPSSDDDDDESVPSSFASFERPSTGRPVGGASAAQARAALFGGQTPGELFKD